MIRRFLTGVALVTAAAIVVPAASAGADDARLIAYMSGAAERPGPGDPDAFGRAYITINDAANQLCLDLQFANVDGTTLTGLHIHFAPPTSAGPIVVGFAVPPAVPTATGLAGQSSQCVIVANEALLDNIAANPQQYYINLHSNVYPGGAIRGQLQSL